MSVELSEKFSKTDRILKRDDFRRVYEKGRKLQARYFSAFVLPNTLGRSRIGITATRKFGNSVKRNRARRLIREAFRRNKVLAPAGVDLVINVKRALNDASYRDLEGEFVALLKMAGNQ